MPIKIEFDKMVGNTYSYLTLVRHFNYDGRRHYVEVLCYCGKSIIVEWENLKKGRTKSCGCKRFPGPKLGRRHPLYRICGSIKDRCMNPRNKSYSRYGGRGVRICKEWLEYENFYTWCIDNGWKDGLQVDKDKKGNGLLYSPNTCSLITHKENMRFRRDVKINSEIAEIIRNSKEPASVLADRYGFHKNNIWKIKRGESWGK